MGDTYSTSVQKHSMECSLIIDTSLTAVDNDPGISNIRSGSLNFVDWQIYLEAIRKTISRHGSWPMFGEGIIQEVFSSDVAAIPPDEVKDYLVTFLSNNIASLEGHLPRGPLLRAPICALPLAFKEVAAKDMIYRHSLPEDRRQVEDLHHDTFPMIYASQLFLEASHTNLAMNIPYRRREKGDVEEGYSRKRLVHLVAALKGNEIMLPNSGINKKRSNKQEGLPPFVHQERGEIRGLVNRKGPYINKIRIDKGSLVAGSVMLQTGIEESLLLAAGPLYDFWRRERPPGSPDIPMDEILLYFGYYLAVMVSENLYGTEVAEKLVSLSESVIKENDKKIYGVYLHVIDYNRRAQRFYKRLGFQTVAVVNDHYLFNLTTFDAYLMAKLF